MTTPADEKYAIAMAASDDLLAEMRSESVNIDPIRSMLGTIWLQRNNVPFMATVVEAVEEGRAPIDQDPTAVISPRPTLE